MASPAQPDGNHPHTPKDGGAKMQSQQRDGVGKDHDGDGKHHDGRHPERHGLWLFGFPVPFLGYRDNNNNQESILVPRANNAPAYNGPANSGANNYVPPPLPVQPPRQQPVLRSEPADPNAPQKVVAEAGELGRADKLGRLHDANNDFMTDANGDQLYDPKAIQPQLSGSIMPMPSNQQIAQQIADELKKNPEISPLLNKEFVGTLASQIVVDNSGLKLDAGTVEQSILDSNLVLKASIQNTSYLKDRLNTDLDGAVQKAISAVDLPPATDTIKHLEDMRDRAAKVGVGVTTTDSNLGDVTIIVPQVPSTSSTRSSATTKPVR